MSKEVEALRKITDELKKVANKYEGESKNQHGDKKLKSLHKAAAIYEALIIIEDAITNYHLTQPHSLTIK